MAAAQAGRGVGNQDAGLKARGYIGKGRQVAGATMNRDRFGYEEIGGSCGREGIRTLGLRVANEADAGEARLSEILGMTLPLTEAVEIVVGSLTIRSDVLGETGDDRCAPPKSDEYTLLGWHC